MVDVKGMQRCCAQLTPRAPKMTKKVRFLMFFTDFLKCQLDFIKKCNKMN